MSQADSEQTNIFSQFQSDLNQLPHALTPVFSTPMPNLPIVLHEGELMIYAEESNLQETGTIALNWLPSPSIDYQIHVDRIFIPPQGPLKIELKPENRILSGYGYMPSLRVNEEGHSMKLRGQILSEGAQLPKIAKRATFHLVNFHNYLGTNIRYERASGQSGWYRGRLQMRNEKWKITIDKINYEQEIWTEISRSHGYGITHVGRLERIDGDSFILEEAEEVLNALVFLLAFLRGNWVGPILVTYDVDNRDSWIDFKLRNTGRWHSSQNWLPRDSIISDDQFNNLFATFLNYWNDEQLWKPALRTLVFWYVESTVSQSAEAGIVLSTTALELVYWVHCVESPITKSTTKTQAESKSFEKKLAALLELAALPSEIPEYFHNLRSISEKITLPPYDGPKTFSKLRNSIVHPKLKHRQTLFEIPSYARIQAKHLGLMYLEQVLLNILGYKGIVQPRDKMFQITGGD